MLSKCLYIRLLMVGQSKVRIGLFVKTSRFLDYLLQIFVLLSLGLFELLKNIIDSLLLYGAKRVSCI